MMTWVRGCAVAVAIAAAACASPSATQATTDAEIAAMAPLKHAYPAVVMGFDVHGSTALVVSLDLQAYDGMNDDDASAMERRAVADWQRAWKDAHPGLHARLQVRFIDFIGRKILERSVSA